MCRTRNISSGAGRCKTLFCRKERCRTHAVARSDADRQRASDVAFPEGRDHGDDRTDPNASPRTWLSHSHGCVRPRDSHSIISSSAGRSHGLRQWYCCTRCLRRARLNRWHLIADANRRERFFQDSGRSSWPPVRACSAARIQACRHTGTNRARRHRRDKGGVDSRRRWASDSSGKAGARALLGEARGLLQTPRGQVRRLFHHARRHWPR